jgi:hypothetical protein
VTICSMQTNTPDLERLMLRMGSIAFLAGLVIAIVSTYIHSDREDLMDNQLSLRCMQKMTCG